MKKFWQFLSDPSPKERLFWVAFSAGCFAFSFYKVVTST